MNNDLSNIAKILAEIQKRNERLLKISNPYANMPTFTIPSSTLKAMSTMPKEGIAIRILIKIGAPIEQIAMIHLVLLSNFILCSP
ncbi:MULTISPECIES: hypothetical protein [Peribacillus]|uniref:hypothetical protein n=1 Tax=Peribacillus TaxID=2675229 RepID=UPI000BA58481|nr:MULTISPECIES: hypothetical protein [Peribacillus]MCY9139694.1 hypothetical protein [Peribacillus frigoritolerans]PAK34470.1 hypothetical protein CHI08_25525 [Peribacillus simplex]